MVGLPPKSSILIGVFHCKIINHPHFAGSVLPLFLETPICYWAIKMWWMPFFLVVTLCSGPPPWFTSLPTANSAVLEFLDATTKTWHFFGVLTPKIQIGALRAQNFRPFFFERCIIFKKTTRNSRGQIFWADFWSESTGTTLVHTQWSCTLGFKAIISASSASSSSSKISLEWSTA